MTVKTHGVTSLALGLVISGATLPGYANLTTSKDIGTTLGTLAIIMLGTFAGGMYPDFDKEDSILYADEVYTFWEDRLDHRGVTHTTINAMGVLIPFLITFASLKAFVSWNPNWVLTLGVTFSIGCLWHMVLDSFTPKGIMWLHPFSLRRFSIPLVKNYFAELVFSTVVTGALLVVAGYFWFLYL